MEVEFDKEIDALLRRETGGRTITIGEFAGGHPDADEIAAFVERAMPESTRSVMTNHFADCDPCRRVLSNVIVLGLEDTSAPEEKASAVPVAATLPWYRRFFQFPQLAYTLGGLLVLFAGFIGVSVMFNSQRDGASFEMSKTVANMAEQPAESAAFANTNAAANAPATAANTMPNTAAAPSDPNVAVSKDLPLKDRTLTENEGIAQAPTSRATQLPGTREERARAGETPADADDSRDDWRAVADRENEAKVESLRSLPAASPPPAPPKAAAVSPAKEGEPQPSAASPESKKKASPAGANTVAADRKQFRGKTFEFRQGAWYDTTYRGQGTINVRRNTEAYRKLDGGLRSIAESFIGTVVTIWNGKAYRID